MADDEAAESPSSGGLTAEDRRLITRYLSWTLGIELVLIALAGWYGGVKWALILAAILMLGVGYGLVGMKKELRRRRAAGDDQPTD
jgi:hypothetical protein